MQCTPRSARALALVGLCGVCLAAIEPLLPSPFAPRINVRWNGDIGVDDRQQLESRFRLVRPAQTEGTTWRYDLADVSHGNIAALIAHPAVSDTHEIDRELAAVTP